MLRVRQTGNDDLREQYECGCDQPPSLNPTHPFPPAIDVTQPCLSLHRNEVTRQIAPPGHLSRHGLTAYQAAGDPSAPDGTGVSVGTSTVGVSVGASTVGSGVGVSVGTSTDGSGVCVGVSTVGSGVAVSVGSTVAVGSGCSAAEMLSEMRTLVPWSPISQT